MRLIRTAFALFVFLTNLCLAIQCQAQEEITLDNVYEYNKMIAQEIVEKYPNSAQSHFLLGYVHQLAKKFPEAIAANQKGLELAPNSPEIVQQIAYMHYRMHDYPNAIQWYQKTLAAKPNAPKVHERIGTSHRQLNEMEKARDAYAEEIKLFPGNAIAHYYLAERLFEEKRYDEAIHHASQTIQLDSRFSEPFYLLAKIHRKTKEQAKFKEMMGRFQEKMKEDHSIGEDLLEDNDPQSAKTMASQIHLIASQICANHQDREKSERHLLKAVEIDPANVDARYKLSGLYQSQKQYSKAEAHLRRLVEIQPSNSMYLLSLGLILSMQNKWDQAILVLEQAHSLDSSNSVITASLGQALLDSGADKQRALILLEHAAMSRPSAMAYNLLSKAYYMNQRLNDSLAAMKKAAEMEPGNPAFQSRYQKLKAMLH